MKAVITVLKRAMIFAAMFVARYFSIFFSFFKVIFSLNLIFPIWDFCETVNPLRRVLDSFSFVCWFFINDFWVWKNVGKKIFFFFNFGSRFLATVDLGHKRLGSAFWIVSNVTIYVSLVWLHHFHLIEPGASVDCNLQFIWKFCFFTLTFMLC